MHRRLVPGTTGRLALSSPRKSTPWTVVWPSLVTVLSSTASCGYALASRNASTTCIPMAAPTHSLPTTMRAVVAAGGLCEMISRSIPVASGRQLLIRVHYTAVNRADTLQRKGLYPPPPGAPDVLGLEAVGEVVGYGPACTLTERYPSGSRVMALLPGGGNAEFVAVDERHVAPIPTSLSWPLAAAIPETWMTAYQLLHMVGGGVTGEWVVVHAAGSGVGTAAVQLAVGAGMHVIAVAGSDAKCAAAKDLGATTTINYKSMEGWGEHITTITGGRGADLILDPVGGSFWRQNAQAIGMDGRWVLYGSMGGVSVDGGLFASILRKRVAVMGTTLRNRSDEYKADLVARFTTHVLPKLDAGQYKPIVDRMYPLASIQEAHAYMESNANVGKIVLQVMPT